jgi:hypothetical protein
MDTTTKGRLEIAAAIALAVGLAATATVADAQGRGGRSSAGFSGGKPGGGWSGGYGGRGGHGWQGTRGGGWQGGGHGWHGGGRGGSWHSGGHSHRGHWHGHGGSHWHGSHWHGGYWGGYGYWYPGWTLGLGVGIGLAYPWWAWSYWPPEYVAVERVVVDRPAGYVIGREGAFETLPQQSTSARWYCTSPAGYYPEVNDCPSGWLKVVPNGGPPPSPATPPASTEPAPRSETGDEEPAPEIAPGAVGTHRTDGVVRIAAPRMSAPPQLAREVGATRLAQGATR